MDSAIIWEAGRLSFLKNHIFSAPFIKLFSSPSPLYPVSRLILLLVCYPNGCSCQLPGPHGSLPMEAGDGISISGNPLFYIIIINNLFRFLLPILRFEWAQDTVAAGPDQTPTSRPYGLERVAKADTDNHWDNALILFSKYRDAQ